LCRANNPFFGESEISANCSSSEVKEDEEDKNDEEDS